MGNVIKIVKRKGRISKLPTLVEKKSKQTDLNKNNTSDRGHYLLMTYFNMNKIT